MAIITLLTDFGRSEYVAQMKGVIHGIDPDARIVDITHDISPQNIFEGAFVLMSTVPHFKDAVHVAVVDPGVGSDRPAIAIECENGVLVGPDNGLLFPASKKLGLVACYEITNERVMATEVSDTFHGRDIFAPAAAHISAGTRVSEVGGIRKGEDMVLLDVEWHKVTSTRAEGRVGRVDRFGNIITNIPRASIEGKLAAGRPLNIEAGGEKARARFVRTYSDGEAGEMVSLFSSSGYLEISVRDGSARGHLSIGPGDIVVIRF
jgi:S-adenosylmethionine hydrolase